MTAAPPLPAVPWLRSGTSEEQQILVGASIRPLDTGRLKMDALELTTHLTAALEQPDYPTTVVMANGTILTYGPPVLKDHLVMKILRT